MIRDNLPVTGADQPQVFISYARKDAGSVDAITRLLEEAGVSIWRDSDRILGGQYFGEAIVHAIAHSRVLLLMCSPHSFESDNVFREVALTWNYHKRYLPVWLTAPVEIPERLQYALATPQWVEAHSGPPQESLPRLLKALSAMGVDIEGPSQKAVTATPASGDRPRGEKSPGLRFKPGDRPIAGSDWVLETLLGKGGFGEVWKAHYPHLRSLPPVALKFCLDLDTSSRDLLHHEADMVLRAQKQIRSDGIVPLLHAYLNNDPPCLEYSYIEGGTLARLLDERRQSPAGSFTPAQVERIILQIARIVGVAHRAVPKLIHRDLKPSNVLAERLPDGKIKIRVTDFGIGSLAAQPVLARSRSSAALEGDLAAVLTGAYSPLYASPQQVNGKPPDPRDDVYALGVIWHQLLTGDLTSPAPTGRRWADEIRQHGTSDAALDLLSSCFESNPAHRPDDAIVLAEMLEAISSSPAKKNDASQLATPHVETKSSPSVAARPRTSPARTVRAPRSIEPAVAPAVASPRSEPEFITTKTGGIKLKLIPAGEFMMGSEEGQGSSDEHPRHRVRITRPFYLAVHEVTQDQYEIIMGRNPSHFSPNGEGKDKIAGVSTGAHPVENVSWLDAVRFCNKLSDKERLNPFYHVAGETVAVVSWSGVGYRLPTEAEWEYASGGDQEDLSSSAWHNQNSGRATHPVGQKRPNRLGLYDMIGNVGEWCWDSYDGGFYNQSPSEDPRGPSGTSPRVFRGGGWYDFPRFCRSASRSWDAPSSRDNSLGFRVARSHSQR
jgi:formylglycine-generating enzyme required for sulfatase activity